MPKFYYVTEQKCRSTNIKLYNETFNFTVNKSPGRYYNNVTNSDAVSIAHDIYCSHKSAQFSNQQVALHLSVAVFIKLHPLTYSSTVLGTKCHAVVWQ